MSRRDWLRVVLVWVAIALLAVIWIPWLARMGEPQSVWIMGLFQ